MEIVQIPLSKMAIFSYIIGDRKTGTCALIDPAFETDRILAEVSKRGYTLTHLFNTHSHPDHSAGNAAIIEKTGARFLIHHLDAGSLKKISGRIFTRLMGGKRSPAPDRQLKHGDEIKIGDTLIRIIHTPGHTPGGICLLAGNNLFTGDTLFAGAVGRTDLPGGSLKTLIKSIMEKLYTLPGETIVWPGHNYGPSPSSTLDYEKRNNPYTRKAKGRVP